MRKGFGQGLGQYLFSWWGFVFTIGGTIACLLLAGVYWWIAPLVVLANSLACGFYAYAKHRGEARAKEEQHATSLRLQEAERKLNEVPLGLLARVNQIVESASFAEFARLLPACAEVICRHKEFMQVESKPLALTTFARQGEQLFVLAKASGAALRHLRVGDPFVLVKKTSSGVDVALARLAVHQPPDSKKEVVHFGILSPIPPELQPMADLAIQGDVSGVKGYSLRPAYDISKYAALDLASVPAAIPLLIGDIARGVPGVSP